MGFGNLAEVFVEVGTKLNPLKGGLARAKGMVSGFAKEAGGIMGSGFAALGLVAGIGATIALAVKEFAEAEKAERGLASALKATGQEVDSNLESMKKLAEAVKQCTTIDDDEVIAAMKVGVQMGLTGKEASEAAKAAVGLAGAYGIDLKDAMSMVSKEMSGIPSRLQKQIPELNGVTDANERLRIINEKAAQGMQEQFDATGTTAGSFEQLKNTTMDLLKSLGGLISSGLTPLMQWINNLIQATMQFGSTSESMFSGAGEAVGSMGSFMGDVFKAIGSWISDTIFFFMTLGTRGKIMGAAVMVGFGSMLDAGSYAFSNLVSLGSWLWDNLGNLFSDGVNFVGTVFSNLFENTKRVFTGIWDWIKSGGKKGFEKGFVGITEGFTAKTKTLPEYKKWEEGTLTKVAKEDMANYQKDLDKKKEAWGSTLAEMPKQAEKTQKELANINVGLTDAGQERVDEKQKKEKSNVGTFSSPAEVWKTMQSAVLKSAETKAEKLAKDQLNEQKKMNVHLAKIADQEGLSLED